MALTVKRRFHEPKGPRRMSRRYTIRPATTDGIPIRVRQILTTMRFPGKRLLSRSKPKLIPSTEAIRVDPNDILRVTPMISRVSVLKSIGLKRFKPGYPLLI
jgi:hypothetical protein